MLSVDLVSVMATMISAIAPVRKSLESNRSDSLFDLSRIRFRLRAADWHPAVPVGDGRPGVRGKVR